MTAASQCEFVQSPRLQCELAVRVSLPLRTVRTPLRFTSRCAGKAEAVNHSDLHIVKKEDQFQEQSLSEQCLFCRHLTEVYAELTNLGSCHLLIIINNNNSNNNNNSVHLSCTHPATP